MFQLMIPLTSLSSIIGLRDALNAEDCGGSDSNSGVTDTISIMEFGEGRILGDYQPNTDWLVEQLMSHVRYNTYFNFRINLI